MTVIRVRTVRRRLLAAPAIAALGAFASGCTSVASVHVRARKSPIVLVHGAWYGGWCWKKLTPLLEQRLPVREKPLFWQWADGKAIRKGKWKLVSDNNEPWELYDVSHDQTETDNLIDEYPHVAEELKREWHEWMGATKADESARKQSLTGRL